MDTSEHDIPADTYETLVHATLVALIKQGYSDLTVRDIDEEWEKSRQLINYYFDGKDELLTTVLIDLIETGQEFLDIDEPDNPYSQLKAAVDAFLIEPEDEDIRYWEFLTAIYEMQSQAHRHPDYAAVFNQISDESITSIAEIIEAGIDQGQFRPVDSVAVATFIDDTVTGAHVKKIHLGQDEAPLHARKMIHEFVIQPLLTDEVSVISDPTDE